LRTLAALGPRIVLGELPAGHALDLVALGEEYGVSRTVVREVLRVLSAKGLVDARPRRGTVVLPRNEWSMLDPDVLRWRFEDSANPLFLEQLFEIRLAVEPMVAGLAAHRRDDGDLASLHLALGAMRMADDSNEHVEADLSFHRALLGAAHNELLEHLATVIEIGLRIRDRIVHSAISDSAVDEHDAVLDAVRAKDTVAAEAAMRALLQRSLADTDAATQLIGSRPNTARD
jgi:DNA-binding FadR family transcriptional regulator